MQHEERALSRNLFVRSLDKEFASLHARSRALLEIIATQDLYRQPREFAESEARAVPIYSCGENLLRAAAIVEQTFGGITANLWDDPFEWTLPETLSTAQLVADYLSEVEATRQRGFSLFKADTDLQKEIVVPSCERQTLCALLIETLARAAHLQGRAFAIFKLFSNARLPQL
jgi:hypothetical protein